MTRSHKFNDRVYGEAAEEAGPQGQNLPRFFGKNAAFDTDNRKIKKDGGGKGNWGHPGEEAQDLTDVRMSQPRRRSNSSSHAKSAKDFKTKFETIEHEPVFEASEHGPTEEDLMGVGMERQSTISSDASSGHVSVSEEK